jgi:hypothetical protein
MDVEPASVATDVTSLVARSRSRLRATHETIAVAAVEWGLRQGHPEWRFVSALIDAQASFADLVVEFADELTLITAEHREAAKVELKRQNGARDETKFQLTQARGAIRDLDVEKARMADEMLKAAVPQLVKGVKDAAAIREVWVSRGRAIQQALIVAAAVVLLLVGGYSWRMVQVWNVSDAALRNSEGIDSCKASSHYVDSEGHRLCRLDAFTASEADAK